MNIILILKKIKRTKKYQFDELDIEDVDITEKESESD